VLATELRSVVRRNKTTRNTNKVAMGVICIAKTGRDVTLTRRYYGSN